MCISRQTFGEGSKEVEALLEGCARDGERRGSGVARLVLVCLFALLSRGRRARVFATLYFAFFLTKDPSGG